jgi:hypothetical protein
MASCRVYVEEQSVLTRQKDAGVPLIGDGKLGLGPFANLSWSLGTFEMPNADDLD